VGYAEGKAPKVGALGDAETVAEKHRDVTECALVKTATVDKTIF
jgi:hypothetical protein